MNRFLTASLGLVALAGVSLPASAQTSPADLEFAFLPSTMTVTLLNEGGKYVAIDLKHIAQGEKCRMDKDATVVKVGPGAAPGTVRVRYAAGQISSGGCPFMTMFDISEADYAQGRTAFAQAKDEAWKKVDSIKKDLGDKWNELIGKKS